METFDLLTPARTPPCAASTRTMRGPCAHPARMETLDRKMLSDLRGTMRGISADPARMETFDRMVF